ncbi:S8 family serine peptidase, partial [bacterium]|nr:S8 family serine peptidase [candidate division CSSED10-310 bacterium]
MRRMNCVCMIVVLLPAVVSATAFEKFDAALNTVLAGIEAGVPLPPDMSDVVMGGEYPIVLHLDVGVLPGDVESEFMMNEVFLLPCDPEESLVPAVATVYGLYFLASHPMVMEVFSGIPIKAVAPLDVSAPEIWANSAWYITDPAARFLRGTGYKISIADTGVDIYHPEFFDDDPATYTFNWYDNGNGAIDNSGGDWVDLNGDMSFQPGEVLRFFDGRTTDWQGVTSNTDGVYQANVDWLYNDVNNNGTRDFGTGYMETAPGLGELLLLAVDTSGNNTLDVGEQVVGLNNPKILAAYNQDGTTRRRGIDLMMTNPDTIGHGTEVCGILAGGWPGFSRYTGIAPEADLLMYNRMGSIGMANYRVWSQANSVDVMLWELGAWVGLYLDGSDWMDQEVDAGHTAGILQVVPAGNLAGCNRHVLGQIDVGTPTEWVFAWVPSSPAMYHLWITLLWSSSGVATPPTFNLVDQRTSTFYMNMPGDGVWRPIGSPSSYQFMSLRQTSSRGTPMFHIEIQHMTAGTAISSGYFEIQINSATGNATFPLHAYAADDTTGWSGGVALAPYGNINLSDAGTITCPSTADRALSVASYSTRADGGNSYGVISWFSGRGPRIDGQLAVDVAAPGDVDIYTAASLSESVTNFIGEYREFGGTSAAGPHVAGAAALYMQFNPGSYAGNPAVLFNRICNDAISDGYTGVVPNTTWGQGKLRIAITPTVFPTLTPTPGPIPLDAEYGDAPDESYIGLALWDAYPASPSMEPAHFPTCFNTRWGVLPFGVHHLNPNVSYLSFTGMVPTIEFDVNDGFDPDMAPNLDMWMLIPDLDDDGMPGPPDDGVTFQFAPDGITVQVNVMPSFINYLVDLNHDGDWNEQNEHLLVDVVVNPGAPVYLPLPAPGYAGTTGDTWVRVTSTRNPIAGFVPIPWDGSVQGFFEFGETEDYVITIPGQQSPTPSPTRTPTRTPTLTPTLTPTESVVPLAEFGDAPDESYSGLMVWDAYPASPSFVAAHFPTCYVTNWGMMPFGVHHLNPFFGYLSFAGLFPTTEIDVNDPFDPDMAPNLDVINLVADMDDDGLPGPPDDGVMFQFAPDAITVVVNAAQSFINYLVDLNHDGDWNEQNEHLLVDVLVAPGAPVTLPLMPGYGNVSGDTWVRVTSTLNPISLFVPIPWDGSVGMPFEYGETEDYLITIPGVQTPTIVPPTSTPTRTPSRTPTLTPTPTGLPVNVGEYGDAPDDSYSFAAAWDAYPLLLGLQPAHFPSCFMTSWGVLPMGVHHLNPNVGFLSFAGSVPTMEFDVNDPTDPDMMPNLDVVALVADMDDDGIPGPPDDGVMFQFAPPSIVVMPNAAPCYINYLADLNQDGDWNEQNEHLLV